MVTGADSRRCPHSRQVNDMVQSTTMKDQLTPGPGDEPTETTTRGSWPVDQSLLVAEDEGSVCMKERLRRKGV